MLKLKVPKINMLTNLSLKWPSSLCVIKVNLHITKNYWNCFKNIRTEKLRPVNFSNFGLISDFLTRRLIAFRLFCVTD